MTKETYTEAQIIFVDTYIEVCRSTGNKILAGKEAKKAAGYPEDKSITPLLRAVKDLLVEETTNELIRDIPKMLHGLESVIDNPAIPGAKNIIAAASTWLDRAGIIKKEESTVNVKMPDGVLVLPAKNSDV